MTHQFKFGDLVLWDINPSPFVFMGVSKIDPDLAWIRADNDLPYFAPFGELKPVPHPDTVRLDWLADPANEISKVMLPGWCSDEYNSLRDAIDAAMRIQVTEAV